MSMRQRTYRTDGFSNLQIPSEAEKNILLVEVGDPMVCVINNKHEMTCWTNINLIGK